MLINLANCRVKIYINEVGHWYMIGQSIFHLITVIFMVITGDADVNPGELLAMLMNAIGMGLAIMLLIVLVVLQLLGIIPNPWPWMI